MKFNQSKEVWGLVDCDSFFANCMILQDPSLRGKIVCVGYDIIVARTHSAKEYGITVGTPIREAKKLLPKDAVICRPNFPLYTSISQRLMSYLREKTQYVQQSSIDEAFFTMTGFDKQYNKSYEDIAEGLKHDIKKIVGIPVSLGLAPTRLLAKMFADHNKPFGTVVALEKQQIQEILKQIDFKDIPFIGPKTHQKLSYCCSTAYDFISLEYAFVKEQLGRSGLKIRLELQGVQATGFQNNKSARSIGRSYSFNPHFTNKKQEVWNHLLKNIERAVHQLIKTSMRTKYIRIFFRTKSFQRFYFDKRLDNPIDDRLTLIKYCRELFEKAQFDSFMYRSTGVRFVGLETDNHKQVGLFENMETRKRNEKLNKTIHTINTKYGPGTITSG